MMDKETREYFIRTIERECKNHYKNHTDNSKGRYEIAKTICLELEILSDNLIKELEEHMKEQHGKRDCKT